VADSLFDACACAGKCLCTFFTEHYYKAPASEAVGLVQYLGIEFPVQERLVQAAPEIGYPAIATKPPYDLRATTALDQHVPAKLATEAASMGPATVLASSPFLSRGARA
jgi:hypothetical protein